MKRRGGRIISSNSAVVPVTDSVSADTVPSRKVFIVPSSDSLNAIEVTQSTVKIPTINIFDRFQSHRDDFDADWLLLKEDSLAGEEKPPLSAHVAEKLRRHQAQLGAHRAAAAADRSSATAAAGMRGTLNNSSSGTKNVVGGLEEVDGGGGLDTAAAPAAARRQRRPDMYDSAEDELSQPVKNEVVVVTEGDDAVEKDDDVEYVPEDRRAAQYQAKRVNAPKFPSQSSPLPAVVSNEGNQKVPAGVAPGENNAALSVGAEENAEDEGLTGDYLNFQSIKPTGAKALAAGSLQATVHMPLVPPFSISSAKARSLEQQQQQQQGRQHIGSGYAATAGERVVVVPLWSTARMEQHGGYCATNPLIALHQEITDLVDFLRPTEAEVTMRRFIEMEVGKLVKRLWPGSHVLVYGSMYTHLLLPQSDLDMTLLDVPVPPEEALTALAKEISNEGLCENAFLQLILKTKVPLIKFAHKGSLIDVDISIGAVDGKRNSECVIRYLNTYPEALPLVMTVKYFLMQRSMHEPYHGGLGSYAATLLVVAFLRQHPIYTTNPEQRPMTGLGKLLVDFLRMCGQFWNYARVAVSLSDLQLSIAGGNDKFGGDTGDFHVRHDLDWSSRMQSPVSPSSPRTPLGPAQGNIADPVDAANNAASSLRLFHSVSSMFTHAYLALTADFDAANTSSSTDYKSNNNLNTSTEMPPASTPSEEDLTRRPTLLSRIFHVDAGMVFHRKAIATTYERLCTEMPAYMAEVRCFHKEEDAAMLPSNARSWRQRRLQQRGGDNEAPFLWERQTTRSVTSLEERLALAHLHREAAATTTSSPSNTGPAAGNSASVMRDSGNPWKRFRPESGNNADGRDSCRREEEKGTQRTDRRAPEPNSVSSSRLSSLSSEHSGYDSDTKSNASSVRVDVTRKTERSRRMHRN